MKGSKDGRGDGSNHRGGGGGGPSTSVSETGALFPRLHVKETKRVGPRAPPRNKMALYEQFTYPSHRFLPPSAPLPSSGRASGPSQHGPQVIPTGEKMALYEQFTLPSHGFTQPSGSLPSSGQPSGSSSSVLKSSAQDGSRYYCPLPFGSMGMPYMTMNHYAGQPSSNVSGSSTVVDGEEMQRAPAIPSTDSGVPASHGPGQPSPRLSTHANVRSIASKKGRTNDDCTVPIYTAPQASSGHSKAQTEAAERFPRGPWQAGRDFTNVHQSIPACYDQVKSSGPTVQRTDCRGDSVTGLTEESRGADFPSTVICSERGVGEEVEQPEGLSGGSRKETQVPQSRSRHSHHLNYRALEADHSDQPRHWKSRQYVEDTSDAECLRSSGTGNGECLTVLEEDEAEFGSKPRKTTSKVRLRKDVETTESLDEPPERSSQGLGKKEKAIVTDKTRKQPVPAECRSSTPGCSDENVENPSDFDASEDTQPTLWSDSEESDASMGEGSPSTKITPKDLINAVGQQEFWRVRKLLERQQTIFSTQVFELHRLIKVQQLLAAPDDEVSEGADHVASPSPFECGPEKAQVRKAAIEKQVTAHGLDENDKNKRITGQQPDSTCQSSSSKRVCLPSPTSEPQCSPNNATPAPVPSAATPTASGAWGYPPFVKPGASGWYGAVPAVNGAYMFQPYPGSYPPLPAHAMGSYDGSYRPVMCAPTGMDVPGMSSYGMPGYEQRPDLMQDMYRYNAMQQQWQAAMYCNSVAQDPSAAWFSVPPMQYMDPSQRMSSRWFEEMNSQRVAHHTSSPLMPPVQAMGYSMHSPWSDRSPKQPQSREGDRVGSQSWEGDRVGIQASWQFSGANCQTPDSGFQRSDSGFQRPAAYPGPEESGGVSVSHQAHGHGDGWGKAWQESDDHSDRHAAEATGAPTIGTVVDAHESRVQKRSREGVAEVREERDRYRDSIEDCTAGEVSRDALPLFPLVPVANGVEKQKSSIRSFPGVIKVVPRAMVATAESAAEILLSIQKQRQQS